MRKRIFQVSFLFLIIGSFAFTFTQSFLMADGNVIDISNLAGYLPLFKQNPSQDLGSEDVYHYPITSSAYDVAIDGDLAFIAAYSDGLRIVDISDPKNPQSVSNVSTAGDAMRVEVDGNFAFVADWDAGLTIINISDPKNAFLAASQDTVGYCRDVCVDGNYAYLAAGDFAVIDISDPNNPGLPVYDSTPTDAWRLKVSGDFAYVSELNYGLRIYNISNPTAPILAANFTGPFSSTYGLDISGNYLYVGDLSQDFCVVNITDPLNPSFVTSLGATFVYDIFVSGDFAYIADSSTVGVVNITDPANPGPLISQSLLDAVYSITISGEYAFVANDASGLTVIKIGEIIIPKILAYEPDTGVDSTKAVCVEGNYVFISNDTGFEVIDITNPTSPNYVTSVNNGLNIVHDMRVSGNFIYLATQGGVEIFDITDPRNPTSAYNLSHPDSCWGIDVAGDFLYVAIRTALSGQLGVVNITNPRNPGSMMTTAANTYANDVRVSGNFAYLALQTGMNVFNITDPNNPVNLGFKFIGNTADAIYIDGNFAFLGSRGDELVTINITDPTNLGAPNSVSVSNDVNDVVVRGDTAFIVISGAKMATINVSDPSNPNSPTEISLSASGTYGIDVDGCYAYVAAWQRGLAVIQVMIPWYALAAPVLDPISPNPSSTGTINLNWNDVSGATQYYIYRSLSEITSLTGLTPIANVTQNDYQDALSIPGIFYYAVVAGNDRGKSYISNCENVTNTGFAGNIAMGLTVVGDYACVACNTEGLAIYNISDPLNLGDPVYMNTTGQAQKVVVEGNYAFIADGLSGLAVIDISNPNNPGAPIYYDFDPYIRDVFIDGNIAFLSTNESSIRLNITEPTSPNNPATGSPPSDPRGVFVDGDTLFYADGDYFTILNITDPYFYSVLNSFLQFSGTTTDIWVSGDTAFISDTAGEVVIVNITDLQNPNIISNVSIEGSPENIFVSGDVLYVADGEEGIAVVDITNLTNPGEAVYIDTDGYAHEVVVSGEFAYVADGVNGLSVFQIGELISENPIYLAPGFKSYAYDVFISGNYAYVANYSNGMDIIDISNPLNPQWVSKVPLGTGNNSVKVFVKGNFAYLACGSAGLVIVNVTDPKNPGNPIYLKIASGSISSVFVSGNYAFVSNQTGIAMASIDVTDPTHPGTPKVLMTSTSNRDICVSGNYAYMAGSSAGLVVVDITDPENPGPNNNRGITGIAQAICIDGDTAYLASYSSFHGLITIDITTPTNPGTPNYLSLNNDAVDVKVSGNRAYVADKESGLAIIDITNPKTPTLIGYQDTDDYAYGVYIDGAYAYLPLYQRGLAVIKIMNPLYMLESPTLQAITPNPSLTGQIMLNWTEVPGATNYYVYRQTSNFTYLSNESLVATVSTNSCIDSVGTLGDYYYVVLAGNDRGKSWMSNVQSVQVIIESNPPNNFSIYSPTDWVNVTAPTVICKFFENQSGINTTTVQYAYSDIGNSTPTNWAPVDGVYLDAACTMLASNFSIGWLYAKVTAAPFTQDSDVNNTIRFRANDTRGNMGNQTLAAIIKIDTKPPIFNMTTPSGNYYNSAPSITVNFFDIYSLDDAYYQIDSFEPTGYNTTGWTAIFTNNSLNFDMAGFDIGPLFNPLSEGSHNIYFKIWDDAENVNETSTLYFQFYKDVTEPNFTVFSPAGNYYNSSPYIQMQLKDNFNLSSLYYQIDSYEPQGSNITGWNPVGIPDNLDSLNADFNLGGFGGLSDGSHTVYFKVFDDAGNVNDSTLEIFQFYKDTTILAPPALNADPPGWTKVNSFNITWANPADPSGIVGAFFKVGSAPTSNYNGTYVSGTGINKIEGITLGTDGSILIYVWLNDSAGNINYNNKVSTTLHLDTQIGAPTFLTGTLDLMGPSNYSATLSWINPFDLNNIIGAYYKVGSPPANNNDGIYVPGPNIASITAYNLTGSGSFAIYIWLNDSVGNCNHTFYANITLEVPVVPPPLLPLLGAAQGGGLNFESIILFIVIGAVAAMAIVSAFVYKARSGRAAPRAPGKIGKAVIIEESFATKSMDEKISYLDQYDIPLNQISDLKDKELIEYFERDITKVSLEIQARIMKLDIPLDEKMEILEEFASMPENLQREFLEELEGD